MAKNGENAVAVIQKNNVHWKEFACGWGAALVNITITYPINKIIFRQMLHGVNIQNAFYQLYNEGTYFLYRGLLPPLFQKTLSVSIMFGVYDVVRDPLTSAGMNPYLAKSVAGMVAGSTEAILLPFERIQTLLSDATYHKHFKNTFDAFRKIHIHYGVAEYYRGVVPILLRNGPSNVCFFILRDEIHARIGQSEYALHRTLNEFICGALIGVLLSSIFYPLNVVKISMQSQLGGPFQNIIVAFKQIYKERGGRLRVLYYGVHTNVTRSFFSWGIMNAAYENIKRIVD